MQIHFWYIGKDKHKFVNEGSQKFILRINRYVTSFKEHAFKSGPNAKNTGLIKKIEAEFVHKKLDKNDYLIILDENGDSMNSIKFSNFILRLKEHGFNKKIIFLIGGAYGLDDSLKKRANKIISLSEMTFSHQIIRIMFLEQLYRAFTILKGEKYHNE